MAAPLTTRLDSDDAIPCFLRDQPMAVAELRRRLTESSRVGATRLLGKILREARDPDVWLFTSPREFRIDGSGSTLGGREALQAAEQIIFNHQCGAAHASKCIR